MSEHTIFRTTFQVLGDRRIRNWVSTHVFFFHGEGKKSCTHFQNASRLAVMILPSLFRTTEGLRKHFFVPVFWTIANWKSLRADEKLHLTYDFLFHCCRCYMYEGVCYPYVVNDEDMSCTYSFHQTHFCTHNFTTKYHATISLPTLTQDLLKCETMRRHK